MVFLIIFDQIFIDWFRCFIGAAQNETINTMITYGNKIVANIFEVGLYPRIQRNWTIIGNH